MSVIFANSEDGGLVNLNHVLIVDKHGRARMSDGGFVQLDSCWGSEPSQIAFLGLKDVLGDNPILSALRGIEDCLNQIRCNL